MNGHAGEECLGPYTLREQLGEGGMGVVYRAADASGAEVAVKVLRQGIPAEATARSRLAREVDMMRRVHNPHVAEVVDADVEGSPPYIVTRYVAGRTLEDVVASEGPLTGPALARLARGLADALTAIHSAGIVHRDLKPGNVLLVDGEPVVIDFGIAQALDSTRLTMTGMFMGTPGYLAPEVIEGRPGGPAADVHSWGATMAYAATGRPPFGTGQFEAIFYRIVHGQPELDTMPAPLLPIVLAALARDPARRPCAADLTALTAGLDPLALTPAPAGAASAAVQAAALAGQATRTVLDLQAPPAPGGQAAAAAASAGPVPPPPAWPGTRPIAVRAHDDFGDLLTPVRYAPAGGPGSPGLAAAPAGGYGVLGPAPVAAFQPGGGQAWPGPRTGSAGPPPPAAGPVRAAAGSAPAAETRTPARVLLVLATLAALVAASVLLPVAGAVAALAVLVLLRATELTSSWLGRRRGSQGPRRSDPVSAGAFYPWAVIRAVLTSVALAPLALLCAAVAAALTVLAAGPGSLPRAGAYAAGALIACYCLGPGSRACRRPLSRFYGRMTSSAVTGVLGSIGLVAIAAAAVAAAVTLAPGYWPAVHLGNQLQTATIHHPGLNGLGSNLTSLGKRVLHWLGNRI
jgi:predicted Ser/Thr protein kinase